MLNKGNYFLIPTTFNPGIHIEYYLIIWYQKIDDNNENVKIFELT